MSHEDTCYECLAHIAFVNNVNSTGSNVSREDAIEGVSGASVTVNNNGEISVSLIINDEILTFCGTPQGKTESGKSIFFDGTSSNEKYEIVDYTYVSDTNPTPRIAAYVQRGFCSKTFEWFTEVQTHTIYWASYLDYLTVPKGQESNQHYRLTVESKSVT